jgi:putative transposase
VVSTHDQDGVTRRARAQQVALFRYQLICPALEAGLSTKARGRVVRAIAARVHQGPFGGQHRYSRDSLDRWIRRYRAGGFDALTPSLRQPGTRIDTGVLELAVALKRENPDRTAAQVARILRASGGYSPWRVHAATAVSPPRVDGPRRWRRCGVRPVRGPDTQRAVGG